MEDHAGSFGGYSLQLSGSHTQGQRNKNIFCELASQEWELGMCVAAAKKVGAGICSICHSP